MKPKSKRSFSNQKLAILSLIVMLMIGCAFYERNGEPIESAVGIQTLTGNEIIEHYKTAGRAYNIGKKLVGVRVGTDLNEQVPNCVVMDVSTVDRKIMLQPPGEELELKLNDPVKARASTNDKPYQDCTIKGWDAQQGMKVEPNGGGNDSEFYVKTGSEIMIPKPGTPSEFVTVIVKSGTPSKFVVDWKRELLIISVDNKAFQVANGWPYSEIAQIEWKRGDPPNKSGKAEIHLAEMNGSSHRGLWIEVHIAKDDNVAGLDKSWLKDPVTYNVPFEEVPWTGDGHNRPRDVAAILNDVKGKLDFTIPPPPKIVVHQKKNDQGPTATFKKDAALPVNKKTGSYVDYKFP